MLPVFGYRELFRDRCSVKSRPRPANDRFKGLTASSAQSCCLAPATPMSVVRLQVVRYWKRKAHVSKFSTSRTARPAKGEASKSLQETGAAVPIAWAGPVPWAVSTAVVLRLAQHLPRPQAHRLHQRDLPPSGWLWASRSSSSPRARMSASARRLLFERDDGPLVGNHLPGLSIDLGLMHARHQRRRLERTTSAARS